MSYRRDGEKITLRITIDDYKELVVILGVGDRLVGRTEEFLVTADAEMVTLGMTVNQYDQLLFNLGCAAGAASKERDYKTFWRQIAFTNRINTGNPEFIPYTIPDGGVSP